MGDCDSGCATDPRAMRSPCEQPQRRLFCASTTWMALMRRGRVRIRQRTFLDPVALAGCECNSQRNQPR
eukprot:9759548-Alexandrium_andersonii.AAC.1